MEQVLRAIEKITKKQRSEIEPHLSLASLGVSSSIGLSRLRATIERSIGRPIPAPRWKMTVADLMASVSALADVSEREAVAVEPLAFALNGLLSLGMDMEDVEQMPETSDYRTHDFYRSHFLPSELATAFLRPDPRIHLCGVFCAKEAVKKAHPELLQVRMIEIVIHHRNGKPEVELVDPALNARFRLQVSITHTSRAAAATCLAIGR